MKLDFLEEPELEFGEGGTHIDVRFGIMQHGPLDRGTSVSPSQIKVGIVGTQETIEGIQSWLDRARWNPRKGKSANEFISSVSRVFGKLVF